MSTVLVNKDCLEHMATLEPKSIDMVCVDPPYGTTRCKWDSVINIDAMWKHLKRVTKPNGVIVVFSAQPFTSLLISSNFKMFKQELIWKKNVASNFLNSNRMHLIRHENICVFYNGIPTYNKQHGSGVSYRRCIVDRDDSGDVYGKIKKRTSAESVDGKRNPISVLDFDRPANNVRCHPSEKPAALLKYLIATYTKEGETVLDFTMGSGSTGVAAKELNRNFIGIEKDNACFELAQKRLSMSIADWTIYIKKENQEKRKRKRKETVKKPAC